MRLQSYFILVAAAALILSGVFSLMNTLGLCGNYNIQTNYANIDTNDTQWTQMTGSTQSQNTNILSQAIDGLTSIANAITSFGYSMWHFLYGIAFIKGIIDQFTQGSQPYDTIAWYMQGMLWTLYGIAGYCWWTGRGAS